MSLPAAPSRIESSSHPSHPTRPPDPAKSPGRRRVNLKGVDIQALTTWLTSNIDDKAVTTKVLDTVRKEDFIEYDRLDSSLGTQKNIVRLVWGGLQRFVTEEQDKNPVEFTHHRGPSDTNKDNSRTNQHQGDLSHVDRHQPPRGIDAFLTKDKLDNHLRPPRHTVGSREDSRDVRLRNRRSATTHDHVDHDHPNLLPTRDKEDFDRKERRDGGNGDVDDREREADASRRDRYFSDEERDIGRRSARWHGERERERDRDRRRYRDRGVSDDERERGYHRSRGRDLSDDDMDGRRRRGRGMDEKERSIARERRKGRRTYVSDDDQEDNYSRRRGSDLSGSERIGGRRRNGGSRERERKRERGHRRGRRRYHSDEDQEDDHLRGRDRAVSDGEKYEERYRASDSGTEEVERIGDRSHRRVRERRRSRERRHRRRYRGRSEDDLSEDDADRKQRHAYDFDENERDGGHRRGGGGDAVGEKEKSNRNHLGHHRAGKMDVRRTKNEQEIDGDQLKNAARVGPEPESDADRKRDRNTRESHCDQDEDRRHNGIPSIAQERVDEISRGESGRPSRDLSDDDWYESRRRHRGSRSRRDRDESRERRRRRRRRRRRLEYEGDEEREYRRRRRHHRRDSRSYSPKLSLSEERDRERRREERRSRRRRRDRERGEEIDRRQSKKRKLGEEEGPSGDDSLDGDRELRKREDRYDYDDGRDHRRDRRKRRKYHNGSSASDGCMSDERRVERRHDRRDRHDRDRYEQDRREDDRRLADAYHKRQDGSLGEAGMDHARNGGLPPHTSSRHGRESELYGTRNDYQRTLGAPRKLTEEGLDLAVKDAGVNSQRESRPIRGEGRKQHGTIRYHFEGGGPLQDRRSARATAEVTKPESKSNQEGVEPRGGSRPAGRPHVTERLGKIEPKNGLAVCDLNERENRREDFEKDVSVAELADAGEKDDVGRRERATAAENAKSKVSKASLGDLRSKALASMKRK